MKNYNRFGNSLRKLEWQLATVDDTQVLFLMQKLNINEALAHVLLSRGINDVSDALNHIDPKLKNALPDPFRLKDMDKAVERIIKAINCNENITVFGDYDVDGASSSAVLKRFFKKLGRSVEVYIPNRLIEGYGPSVEAFRKIKENNCNLIITVDCGTVAFESIEYAVKNGIDVIVIDHHLSLEELPQAVAVVNPNRTDDSFEHKGIAAVGVAFLLTVAIRSKLRDAGWFTDKEEPDLLDLVDLVALGTVCDAMPLQGLNRAFVRTGLKLISRRRNIGIAALADSAGIDSKLNSYHLGFVLGPRINAGGRVGQGKLGSMLLSTGDRERAQNIAARLHQFNEERKAIEAIALEEALEQIESQGLAGNPMVMAYAEGWHPGILGILASRLKEMYNKPSAVISITDGIGKGSARSIPGIDLGSCIALAKAEGILIEGGGHAMAGGFSVEEAKLDEFYNYIIKQFNGLGNIQSSFQKAKTIHIDSIVKIGAINMDLIKAIEQGAPYGSGNPQPKFAVLEVIVIRSRVVGANHVMVIIQDEKSRRTQKCILFRGLNSEIGDFLLNAAGKIINLAGSIQYNPLSRDKVDFIIEDVAVNE